MLYTISALTMRKKFGLMLDRVANKGEHITITRAGEAMATLIPAKEYTQVHERGHRLERLQEALSRLEVWQRRNSGKLKKVSGRLRSEKVIRAMRDDRCW